MLLAFALLLFRLRCSVGANAPAPRVIGFMTDFDVKDDAVGICKAVMLGIAPHATIIDITHQVTPFDIAAGGAISGGLCALFSA